MCQRKEHEPYVLYLLRYAAEQPRTILAVVGLVAAGVMYGDMRALMREQVQAYREVASQLSELNVRITDLEQWHRLEVQK